MGLELSLNRTGRYTEKKCKGHAKKKKKCETSPAGPGASLLVELMKEELRQWAEGETGNSK